ncbi:MAG: phosphotransferase [Clostridia bacterium]|nr:phosphotransferase [Clostridia bacterium]
MSTVFEKAEALYALDGYEYLQVPGHEGGRNEIRICRKDGENRYVLRFSALEDRTEEDYLAEAEFVRYLAEHGAPVADVIPSVNGRLVERAEEEGKRIYICLFEYARGMLLADNGYRYRKGALLEEYFYNTGKALGAIHRLSRQYKPVHRRADFFDKYNMEYIGRLIPDDYAELKQAIARRLEQYRALPTDGEAYGLVHFDFCDGNYHVDMDTGAITVFDFDNCIRCWYMFDLAHVWTHGVGWYRHIQDPAKRMEGMKHYFDTVLEGYRSETDVPDSLPEQLPLFIDMTIIEYIVDEFECSAREGGMPDEEDIEEEADCLIRDIPYGGFGET